MSWRGAGAPQCVEQESVWVLLSVPRGQWRVRFDGWNCLRVEGGRWTPLQRSRQEMTAVRKRTVAMGRGRGLPGAWRGVEGEGELRLTPASRLWKLGGRPGCGRRRWHWWAGREPGWRAEPPPAPMGGSMCARHQRLWSAARATSCSGSGGGACATTDLPRGPRRVIFQFVRYG